MKKILVTGGAGFVGTHLIEHILKNTDWDITSLDRYDASGNPNRLSEMMADHPEFHGRVHIVFWDLKAELNEQVVKQLRGPFDYIAHLAAGSHVDRSIDDPMSFFLDNCIGTINLLTYAHDAGLRREENFSDDPLAEMPIAGRFLYFSTDEVYGPAPETVDDPEDFKHGVPSYRHQIPFAGFKEWARLNPNNPYAAAKAAAEMGVISFANTYRIPCLITNTMNIFGERQNPEKFIPLVINKVLTGEKLLIHADHTKTKPGKRHYLHARNICAATVWALENGKLLDGSAAQGRYNVVGEKEIDNLALAQLIAEMVRDYCHDHGAPFPPELNYELVDFHSSRPGHDLRYALEGGLIDSEGFSFPVSFEDSLRKMIYWTLDHKEKWL
jgi:dTDP-glucose 4,6-dehydratase